MLFPAGWSCAATPRAYSDETRREICGAMERIARGLCDSHRATLADFQYEAKFEATVNSAAETAAAAAAARETAGEVDENSPPMMFSEDFGRMLAEKPGAFIFIGNGENSAPLHSPLFDFNDDILTVGADYWTRLVERELKPPAD